MRSNRLIFTCSLLVANVGLVACVDEEFEPELEPADVQTAIDPADTITGNNGATPYLGPLIECNSHNVIGVLNSKYGYCSLPGSTLSNWQWHTLFEDSTPEVAAWNEAVPGELKRYCSYEYVGVAPFDPDEAYDELFTAINAYPGMNLNSVAPDCFGEVPMGDGLDDPAVSDGLVWAFHNAIQWVSAADLGTTVNNRKAVEVAVLDTETQPAHDSPFFDSVLPHGQFMGDIIGDITCPDGDSDCLDQIRYHVAMPREDYASANYINGGKYGGMGDLATALVAAVGQWRDARLSDPNAPKRLVVSMSLGWMPDLQVTTDPNRGPVRAIEEALIFAACNGAIVLAASGNVSNPACPDEEPGPLAPATYELVERPDQTECENRGYYAIDPINFPVFDNDWPLVNAIGAVDGRDVPLLVSRPESTPPLVAYGANVTVETGVDTFTTPLSGTSSATAVVAGIAGLVWSYAPELTPDQLMALIYDTGFDTGLVADFDFDNTGLDVHRASVCTALESACSNFPPGHCPVLSCGDGDVPADGHLGHYFAAVDTAIADPSNLVRLYEGDPEVVQMCVPPTWSEQIDPQPGHPKCPHCAVQWYSDAVANNDIVSLTIPAVDKNTIDEITLVTVDVTGQTHVFEFDDRIVTSVNNVNVEITQVQIHAPDTVSANLTFDIDGVLEDGTIPVNPPPV